VGIEWWRSGWPRVFLARFLECAGLHPAGMKIQLVRHHRGSKDPMRDRAFAVPAGFRDRENPRAAGRSESWRADFVDRSGARVSPGRGKSCGTAKCSISQSASLEPRCRTIVLQFRLVHTAHSRKREGKTRGHSASPHSDSTLALGFSLSSNAAILVLGAAAFHQRGMTTVADISQAYQL